MIPNTESPLPYHTQQVLLGEARRRIADTTSAHSAAREIGSAWYTFALIGAPGARASLKIDWGHLSRSSGGRDMIEDLADGLYVSDNQRPEFDNVRELREALQRIVPGFRLGIRSETITTGAVVLVAAVMDLRGIDGQRHGEALGQHIASYLPELARSEGTGRIRISHVRSAFACLPPDFSQIS